jgi:integrase
MSHNRLTARTVISKKRRGRYSDGGGLVLQISKWGTKSWIFRYERDGRERHMGLGSVSTVSLAMARDAAQKCRQLLFEARDPIEQRNAELRQRRLERASHVTFKECGEGYIAAHQAGWRNAKHKAQWSSTLAKYVYPILGDLPVSAIDTALVLKCLEPIWQTKPETANRVRGRIESALDWATARGLRSADNPARWRGHLDKLLPATGKLRVVKHHAALPYADLPQFMSELRDRQESSARALELTILTALRTNEVIGARWGEIDFAAKVWTIPCERMKAGQDHRVPLSKRAIEMLDALPRGEFLFADRDRRPLSNMAMLMTLERMSRSDVTVHGFRSTFRDWAADMTSYPNHVVEMALAHAIGDKVEAAYRRGDLFIKRRRLMEDWDKYCGQPVVRSANIVAIHRTARDSQ